MSLIQKGRMTTGVGKDHVIRKPNLNFTAEHIYKKNKRKDAERQMEPFGSFLGGGGGRGSMSCTAQVRWGTTQGKAPVRVYSLLENRKLLVQKLQVGQERQCYLEVMLKPDPRDPRLHPCLEQTNRPRFKVSERRLLRCSGARCHRGCDLYSVIESGCCSYSFNSSVR